MGIFDFSTRTLYFSVRCHVITSVLCWLNCINVRKKCKSWFYSIRTKQFNWCQDYKNEPSWWHFAFRCDSVSKTKSRVVRLNYVLLRGGAPILQAGFRQRGKGLPTPTRNACWFHASCKPSNPWIINSGLQTISASPMHCVVHMYGMCLQVSPYIKHNHITHNHNTHNHNTHNHNTRNHNTHNHIPWSKANWLELYMQITPLTADYRGKFSTGGRISL